MTSPRLISELTRRMSEAGFTQKSLAKAADLNETYVRDILKGRSKNPEATKLGRIAAALGCSVDDLTGVGKNDAQGWPDVALADFTPQVTETPEETEWLGAWRDMSEPQRRRAIALLKAMIAADAA